MILTLFPLQFNFFQKIKGQHLAHENANEENTY
jgi:hypothetical protein